MITGASSRLPVRRTALIAAVAVVVLVGALALALANVSGHSNENLPQPPATQSLGVVTTAPAPTPDRAPSTSVPTSKALRPTHAKTRTPTGPTPSGDPTVVTSVPIRPYPTARSASQPPPRRRTHTPSSTPTPTKSSSSSAHRPPHPILAVCLTSNLSLTLDRQSGSAGGGGAWFRFENGGTQPCTLEGFPTLDNLDSAGNQVGPDAAHSSATPERLVVLRPGQQAEFHLSVTDGGVPGAQGADCPANWSTARTTQIVPPGRRTPLSYSGSFGACDPTVTVVYRPAG